MQCIETKNGVKFGKERAFCRHTRSEHRHAFVRFMIIVNGLQCDSLATTRDVVRETLESALHLTHGGLQTYYWYYRVDTEPFCYTEIYFESTQGFMKGRKMYWTLVKHRQELAAMVADAMKKDLYVEISKSIYLVGNLRRHMVVVIGIVCSCVVVIAIAIVWLGMKHRKEKQIADLLLK